MRYQAAAEDFGATRAIYDQVMADNVRMHDLVYPHVFGHGQYIGQFSDNSADELRLMGKLMQLAPNSHVLDVGCGRGKVAAFMAQEMDWRVHGIDLSHVPLQQAQALAKDSPQLKLEFSRANIYEYTAGQGYDGIYGVGAFCHFDAARLFTHCHSLIRKGGRLAFMERVRLSDEIAGDDWQRLTENWCCPYVYSVEEYQQLLAERGWKIMHRLDLLDNFCIWQDRSVTVRQALREDIIALSSQEYYDAAVAYASYENDVTRAGLLGYTCIVAEKV